MNSNPIHTCQFKHGKCAICGKLTDTERARRFPEPLSLRDELLIRLDAMKRSLERLENKSGHVETFEIVSTINLILILILIILACCN